MSDTQPIQSQAAVVWYKSRIVVGIATIIASRLLDYAQKQWHFDAAVFGVTVNELASLILDGVAGVAAYVALHARVSSDIPIPPVVTLTKSAATDVNKAPTVNPTQPPTQAAISPTSTGQIQP